MDSRERVEAAIRRQRPDRVPSAELVVDDDLVASFLGSQSVGFKERSRFISLLGLDAVCLQQQGPSELGSGLPRAKDMDWPDLAQWMRETDRFVFAMLDGAFGWASKLLGLTAFLVAAQRNALEIVKFVRQVEELNLELVQRAADNGAMGIVIADDFAYRQGLMFRPELMRSLFFPSLAEQVAAAHRAGLPAFLHCDGNLNSVLHDLVEVGFDGLQSIEQAAGMELANVKAQCGENLCLWGNLDPRLLIQPPDTEQLRQAARSITSLADPEGGLIFGTSSGLFAGMSSENLRKLYPLE